ncbi:DUF4139 domain-containing protein [Sphingomonas sp. S2-65]|uniref:DUF4139 domain-containing protein n=1 Tax=Sphingomonas sp. S2-65 TaxID=2903960 RepID=UPI001F23A7C6|nr:hypothetical protein [Sphingomonas sp. S2-65]UYY58288.1 hypothetical protein LZ586_16760 [Sphingomonas sp. S2-65]
MASARTGKWGNGGHRDVRHPFLSMWRRALQALIAVGTAAGGAEAQTVTSPAPERVSLTVYRAPNGGGAIDLRYLAGFAMVTETRRVKLPRGPSVVRFEGVAEGIVPVSAVVDGLPGGTIEKNRDARLLSPASLIDGTLGRQVTLTRTDKATGRQVREEATVVAGPSPGVILRTKNGIEALRCSGLPERLTYDGVPAGLSAKPVLSVTTTSARAQTVTVKLSYLASGFDWRASYVATMAADGESFGLFAWLTLANGNPERFAGAEVQAVAGRLNRVATPVLERAVSALRLTCFPLGTTTSDLREQRFEEADEIVVTGSRMVAEPVTMYAPPAPTPEPAPPPEDLGDLKLYRVPERVTVAARAQKQVALLSQPRVPFARRYRRAVWPGQKIDAATTEIVLVLANQKDAGLGVPLPAGDTALYAPRGDQRLLLGLGTMKDRAVGETLRLAAGISSQVLVEQTVPGDNQAVLRVTNANRFAVTAELPIGGAGQKITGESQELRLVDGIATWTVIVPPGGQAELRYRY